MANRKLGKTTDIRMAMLKTQLSDLILNGKEKDNFDMVEVKVSKAKLDAKGNKVTEIAKSKNGKEYLKVVREEKTEKRQKDQPTRLNARRKMMKMLNKVKDSEGNVVDLPSKLFNEIAPKYADRVGGYTRILKTEQRRGDAAEMVILQLV